MFKKIALCAMLVFILAPASVMAAGQQGQAQGIGNEAGNCQNVQHQTASDVAAQEKSQNGQSQSSQSTSHNGNMLMVQDRSHDQTGDQDMVRNMTRDQVRLNADAGPAENQGSGSNGDARMLQNRSSNQTGDQDQDMMRNMTRDQVRLNSDSVQQQKGSDVLVQNRSGLTRGNGQNILTSFADQLGFQFRNAGGIFQTLLH